ncbi:sigma-70 family RNA polymerase sigma factor [Mediterraneibacter agrestimuris]|uniref:sigma-70 family RNA polymerase sigma factor n=1 Tax=Mediterraneibacter agrestimuris TaxID=2941333 RepID=UPI00203DB197|nr:sigma-70 family RNA polymerase sigma factor [Mediterraneibacter agrestimuris]
MERKKEKSGLTFRQLKEMVGSGMGHRPPTARQLKDSGEEPVAVREIGPDGSLSVYPNGYAVYSNGSGTTVVSIGECGEYTYRFHDGEDGLPTESRLLLDGDDWSVAVALKGEEQIEANLMNRKGDRKGSRQYEEDWEHIRVEEEMPDVLEAVIQKDMLSELMDCLTDRQREVITAYFFDELTQQQIADKLGVGRRTVTTMIERSLEKLRKNIKNL